MAEVVNLRQRRKQAERRAKDETAAENRLRFGRTAAERKVQAREGERAASLLDGHKRDAPSETDRQR